MFSNSLLKIICTKSPNKIAITKHNTETVIIILIAYPWMVCLSDFIFNSLYAQGVNESMNALQSIFIGFVIEFATNNSPVLERPSKDIVKNWWSGSTRNAAILFGIRGIE